LAGRLENGDPRIKKVGIIKIISSEDKAGLALCR
jgi:hypothetical protein